MKKIDLCLVHNCPHGRKVTQYCKHHGTATRNSSRGRLQEVVANHRY